jgi:nicotinamide riboside transporter PnuC
MKQSLFDRLAATANRPITYVLTALLFLAVNAVGYATAGGLDFVQDWGGGLAAVIATGFLVFKTQGYWAWMIVNASLWTYLFFHTGLPMLAYLQISFLIFAGYGAVQWALVRRGVGVDFRRHTDVVGSAIAAGVLLLSLGIYWDQPGYRGTTWWWLELGGVVFAIGAMWMDAFRYKANWIAWSLGNVCSAPLFWHFGLGGAFWTIFLYQAINFVGYYRWSQEERRGSLSAEPPLTGPNPPPLEDDRGLVGAYRYES